MMSDTCGTPLSAATRGKTFLPVVEDPASKWV